ncbi:MAG: hypothetical protein PHT13_00055 [Methanosarcina sp.]|jgi:hypothetical protein|nr:hypothetical protein [Methanosarcina sp.]
MAKFLEGKKYWHINFGEEASFTDFKTVHLKDGMARIGHGSDGRMRVFSILLSKEKYGLTAAKLASFYYVRYFS